MRPDAAAADRRREVREAARRWHEAGLVDDAVRAALEAAHPDDRVRLGPAFRTLAFVFTVLGALAGFALVVVALNLERNLGPLALVFGALLWGLTELQTGPLKRTDAGAETATALLGTAFLLGGTAWLLDRMVVDDARKGFVLAMLTAATALFAVVAVRWGSPFGAGLATLAAFGALAQFPAGRWLWILAALSLAPAGLALGDSAALPPTHRRSVRVVAALSLLALYVAVHIGSWDGQLVEQMGSFPASSGRHSPLRPLFVAATALLPLALVALGLRTRRRLLVDLGLLLGVVSAGTVRFYVHVAPLWVVLSTAGAAMIGAVLILRRFLDAGPERVRGGFTAEPLAEEAARQRVVEAAMAVSMAPKAPAPAAPGFTGGGGKSGGGGATGSY